jgi:rare lipoprotein A (peptidoglycan hydrolase)
MPLRQTIGISLAFLMISAGANAKDREEAPLHHHHRALHHHGRVHVVRHERARTAADRSRAAGHGRTRRHFAHRARSARRHHRLAALHPRGERLDAYWGPVHPTRKAVTGKAAWYHLLGARTASGERLDSRTPTAAHRTLPLDSLARVTDLDNGRSVIVKINDRGPWTRGVTIDLSPRAARLLHMTHSGIADVRIQPLARGPAAEPRRPTALAAYYDAPDD